MRWAVTPEQMQRVDQSMIKGQGISGLLLMEHAAAAVVAAVKERISPAGTVVIFCGGGNNGGDGLAVLRLLEMEGISASAVLLVDPATLKGDAQKQYQMALACKLPVKAALDEAAVDALDLSGASLLVDALFGTGLNREIGGRFARAVAKINERRLPVVAVDIPSGVDGATGQVWGCAVQADVTVTFQFEKYGHILYPGKSHAGEVQVAPIGLPVWDEPAARILEQQDVERLLPARPKDSHKGKNGRGVLCAGSGPYAGAALLCATAALRGGTGLLRVLIPRQLHGIVAACPGAIATPIGQGSGWDETACREATEFFSAADAMGIGPGMGDGEEIADLLESAFSTGKPLVVDADGLNALAKSAQLQNKLHERVILTPHPGEMSRLLHQPADIIVKDPVRAALEAARRWGCVVLLKGATTAIALQNQLTFNVTGNPGLAKGGSGDVLTGLILALLCQGLSPYDAACIGAYLLGSSADQAMKLLGERMLTPMDVTQALTLQLTQEESHA